ncbi:hypothetical protein ACQY0O_007567 [Thecaphora frezii]
MSRFAGRYAPAIEQEVRRTVKEPVVVWRQEWVLPASSAGGIAAESAAASGSTKNDGGLKILKWVKTTETVEFPEDEDQEYAGAVDIEPAAPVAPVIAVAQTPVVESSLAPGMAGGLGSIAPPSDPSPLPAAAVSTEATISAEATPVVEEATTASASHPEALTSIEAVTVSAPSIVEAEPTTTESPAAEAAAADPATAPESRDDTPQLHPQVSGELHPPPSGVPAEEQQPTSQDAVDASKSAEEVIPEPNNLQSEELESELPPSASAAVQDIEARGAASIEPRTEVWLAEEIRDGEAKVDEVRAEDITGLADVEQQRDGDVTMAEAS